jgi:hypothetical protein
VPSWNGTARATSPRYRTTADKLLSQLVGSSSGPGSTGARPVEEHDRTAHEIAPDAGVTEF